MSRTAWLQERRMLKFRDVLSRWEASQLSALEASELLGGNVGATVPALSGSLRATGGAGLRDLCLGKASPGRVPESDRRRMLDLYREMYSGWCEFRRNPAGVPI